MALTIKRLSPALTEDYLAFFDATPHSTGKPEHRCYCVCWRSGEKDEKDFSTAGKRREIAAEYIRDGKIQGYLAYDGLKVVGWVNANAKKDCYECLSWQMFMGDVKRDDAAVRSVFCFAVAPEARKQGVASALIARVCADAREEGFKYIEAYPNKTFQDTETDFMGPIGMYEKAGFTRQYEAGDRVVMRKALTV